uniref:Serine/threonine-protein phosphatase 2A activator n=1 Tax=Theileria annulata TaxID=5874 RepID=A0A3B0N751_THEAN
MDKLECVDIIEFIKNLNESIKGKKLSDYNLELKILTESYEIKNLNIILKLYLLLEKIENYLPNHDPKNFINCRYGNKAFNTFINQLTNELDEILIEYEIKIINENIYKKLKKHFLNSFGNNIRLDFGTGHELEFIYFLMILFSNNFIKQQQFDSLVLILLNKYFELCRKIIERYTLEPAGTKGVWGIDDYQFLPFIFGSSQLINTNINPKHCMELEFVIKYKNDYIFMRAMEYKINVNKLN